MQLKKYILPAFVIALLISTSGLMRFAQAANEGLTATQDAFSDVGITDANYNFAISDFFRAGSYGKNLYKGIFLKVTYEPERKALQDLATGQGFSTEEAKAIINGSIEPIMNKNTTMTQQDAFDLARDLQEQYADFADTQRLEAQTEMGVTPTEIFSNGDITDSGFDLIDDLNKIEAIMFQDTTPPTIGVQAPASGEPDTDVGPGSTKALESVLNDIAKKQSILEEEAAPKPEQAAPIPFGTKYDDAIRANGSKDEPATITPDKCTSTALTATAETFKEEQKIQEQEKQKQEAAANKAKAKTNTSTPKKEEKNGGTTPAAEPAIENPTALDAISEAFEWKDWKGMELCAGADANGQKSVESGGNGEGFGDKGLTTNTGENSVSVGFCIEITTHSKTYSSFSMSDPCISCHVEKINFYLKKTIKHNLLPKKMTGNLLEMGKCKGQLDLGSLLNVAIIPIEMPILTPDGKKAMYGGSIIDEFNHFVKDNLNFNSWFKGNMGESLKPSEDPEKYDLSATEADQALESAMSNKYEADQASVLQEVSDFIAKGQDEADKQLQNADSDMQSYLSGEFFQELQRHLDQMNTFFINYKSLLQQITDEAKKITEKPNCS